MSAKIVMYDDDKVVTETVLAHVCWGRSCGCGSPAVCEGCGGRHAPPVYCWTTSIGMEYSLCGNDIASDDYCDLTA
jgi:hypothetical protein